METTDNGIYLLNAREGLGMHDRVDYACVAAASEYYQSFLTHVQDGALVIHDQRVRFPTVMPHGVVDGETALEFRGAVNFS